MADVRGGGSDPLAQEAAWRAQELLDAFAVEDVPYWGETGDLERDAKTLARDVLALSAELAGVRERLAETEARLAELDTKKVSNDRGPRNLTTHGPSFDRGMRGLLPDNQEGRRGGHDDIPTGGSAASESDELRALRVERDAARDALAFYANADNWTQITSWGGRIHDDESEAILDGGKRAREALAEGGLDGSSRPSTAALPPPDLEGLAAVEGQTPA